ncbi:MAG: hypothetical protein CVU70_01045 [Deltaproteobacteria bacterium HGW-Deltaproteobacteria-5]|nr:MAG: hypothetical protein CVU70_01045 [Deltaproteobacteria bacterium HGW-Deltaproteobacteria-5]
MMRSVLLVTLGIAITAFFSFWSIVFSFFANAENNVHKVARIWASILLKISSTKVLGLDLAALRIREGKSVMTFPEGTRSRDGEIKAFKQGLFYLAIQSGVPIVPISIIGSGAIMPKRSLKVKPGKITLVIDKPITVKGYTLENRQELINQVRQVIMKNYDAYKNEDMAGIKNVQAEIKAAI